MFNFLFNFFIFFLISGHADEPSESEPAADIDCKKMRVKELKKFVKLKGKECRGCAEKHDFVQLCEESKGLPDVVVEEKKHEEKPKSDESIEDIMEKMKGMPGMENMKMYTAEDLKNMKPEDFAAGKG